jgi:thiamine pyrophosphokinase
VRVLIVGAALPQQSARFLADLAWCCDTVVAADGGGALCLSAAIIPDLLVGDMDSLSTDDEVRLREAGTHLVRVPAAKDFTDLDLALDQARQLGADEIWATGVVGSRLDHTLAAIGSLSRHVDARPRVVEPGLSAWFLSPEGAVSLEFRGTSSLVSIFALDQDARVTCTNFRYTLSDELLPPLASRGLSNVIETSPASVRVHTGTVFVVSPETGTSSAAQLVDSGSQPE